jgi:hypothetical protein
MIYSDPSGHCIDGISCPVVIGVLALIALLTAACNNAPTATPNIQQTNPAVSTRLPPTATNTLQPTATPDYPALFSITKAEIDSAGGIANYLRSESPELLLARTGMGEGADKNLKDRTYVMWIVKVRAEIGLSNYKAGIPSTSQMTSITAEGLALKPGVPANTTNPDGYQFSAIGALIVDPYGSIQADCKTNVRRMSNPCDVQEFLETYNAAKTIANSSISSIPQELKGFDTFTSQSAGKPGQKCQFGDYDPKYNRLAEQLAGSGSSVFFDCFWPDNIILKTIQGDPYATPSP